MEIIAAGNHTSNKKEKKYIIRKFHQWNLIFYDFSNLDKLGIEVLFKCMILFLKFNVHEIYNVVIFIEQKRLNSLKCFSLTFSEFKTSSYFFFARIVFCLDNSG